MNNYLIRSLSRALVPIAFMLTARTAAAQTRSNTEGLMLSLGIGTASLDSDEFESGRQTGGGFSAQLGWGFSRRFSLLVDASGAVLGDNDEELVLAHFDLLGRFHFGGPTKQWIPYVEGGLSARAAGRDDITFIGPNGNPTQVDLEISGGGLTLGGGIQYYVSPAWSLGAGLRLTSGEFSTVKFNNVSVDGFEIDATSTRFNFSVTWHPMSVR